jgi:hypothetical protein
MASEGVGSSEDLLDIEQENNCYFCGLETKEFCVGCDESVCENCDVVGLFDHQHRPEVHLGDDEEGDLDLDIGE